MHFVTCLALSPVFASGMSFWAALAQIESGANDYAVGDVGEISRYQIRPEVWRLYSSSKRYEDPAVALRIAQKYMAKLKRDFERATGRAPTETDCVILWKSGMAGYENRGFLASRMSAAHQDRIRRFHNLRPEAALLIGGRAKTVPASAAAGNAAGTRELSATSAYSFGLGSSAPVSLSFFGKAATEGEGNQNYSLFARTGGTPGGADPFCFAKLSNER